ncbi:MAG: hypothetical protein K5767_08960 [Clostridia bacterium]|nr:hypothetical protein [Clostridia bacterium]
MADINATGGVNTALAAAVARMQGKTNTASQSSLNFSDYIHLMVAELQNQDMYSNTDTTKMTEQMAQYSLVTAAEEIIQAQKAEYATSLIGMEATAKYTTLTDSITETGKITGVSLYENEPLVYINGQPFNLSEITLIGAKGEAAETGDQSGNAENTGTGEVQENTTVEGNSGN